MRRRPEFSFGGAKGDELPTAFPGDQRLEPRVQDSLLDGECVESRSRLTKRRVSHYQIHLHVPAGTSRARLLGNSRL